MPNLSKRLSVIASLVPLGARVCDVGTDHAYLAIELVKSGRVEKVIATDIGEKPLKVAAKNIALAELDSIIDLRLGDGLNCISENEADTVIVAGMGGEVISGILEKGKNISAKKDLTLILQPTTSPEALRRFLAENGYSIESEIPVYENQKVYSVMLVKFTDNKVCFDEYFYYIGKVTHLTEEGKLYIKKQQQRCCKCMLSLENIQNKRDEYLYYKNIYNSITDYLENFGEK